MMRYIKPLILFLLVLVDICEKTAATKSKSIPADVINTIDFKIGDPKYCLWINGNQNLIMYEVLPGGGWDNLRNKEAGQLVKYNFSQCRTTDDGKYLIPDNSYTVPLKSSRVETFAELFDHWMNYTSTTATSINVEAGLHLKNFGIDGKFSAESERVKKDMVHDQSVTTRVQARYVRYTAKLQPDSELNPAFKKRLLSIAAHLQLNRTNMARYDSQLLVRDFGTHVITSIDAGAAIVQMDQVKSTFSEKYDFAKNQVLASASATFFSVASISSQYKHTTTKEMIDQYLGNRTHSQISTYGGPIFKPINFTINDWGSLIDNELVAMDRAGDPIFFLITPYSLPELPRSVVFKLIQTVKTAVELYYQFNTYRGCTKMDSPNFSFQANIDDGTCKTKETNFTFGGVYQTCSQSGSISQNLCDQMTQKNPLTGDYSCPDEYEEVVVNSGTQNKRETRHQCHSCWLFFHCCHDNTYYGSATFNSYWCVAKGHVQQQHGFLFGGVYTNTVGNLVTQTRSCPLFFYPLKMGRDLHVCVSDDYELGFKYSVPFAGFYSCKSGNPLTIQTQYQHSMLKSANGQKLHSLGMYLESASSHNWPMACPTGYSQHLATVENGCRIDYCVKANAFSDMGLPAIRRPPFMDVPEEGFTDTYSYKFGEDGQTWERLQETEDTTVPPTQGQDQGSEQGGLSRGAVAGISIFATLACVLVATVIVTKWRQRRKQQEQSYRNLGNECDRIGQNEQRQYGTNLADQPTEIQTVA